MAEARTGCETGPEPELMWAGTPPDVTASRPAGSPKLVAAILLLKNWDIYAPSPTRRFPQRHAKLDIFAMVWPREVATEKPILVHAPVFKSANKH